MVLCEFGFDDKLFAFDVIMLFIIGGVCCFITYAILLVSGWDLSPSLDMAKIRLQEQKQESEGSLSIVTESVICCLGPEGLLIPWLSMHESVSPSLPSATNPNCEITEEDQNNRLSSAWEARYTYHFPTVDDGTAVRCLTQFLRLMVL